MHPARNPNTRWGSIRYPAYTRPPVRCEVVSFTQASSSTEVLCIPGLYFFSFFLFCSWMMTVCNATWSPCICNACNVFIHNAPQRWSCTGARLLKDVNAWPAAFWANDWEGPMSEVEQYGYVSSQNNWVKEGKFGINWMILVKILITSIMQGFSHFSVGFQAQLRK